jgi:hypothetical protein
MRLGNVQGMSRPGANATDTAGSVANEAKFKKDFSLEHSASNAIVPPKD